MKELSPLVIGSAAGFAFGLEELEDEGAASADVVAAGEEVSADEGFEDAGLAAALAPDDGDLGELDRGLAPELGEDVLELVDDRNHGGAQRRRFAGGGRRWRGSGRMSLVGCFFNRHRWIGFELKKD